MNAFNWITLIVLAAAVIMTIIVKLRDANASTDWIVECYTTVVDLVRAAEELWEDVQGAGAYKKEWVMKQLVDFAKDPDSIAVISKMIDDTVLWLNTIGWDN